MNRGHKTILIADAQPTSAMNLIEMGFAAEVKPVGDAGLVWEFLILRAGPAEVVDPQNKMQFFFTPDFVRQAAPTFNGCHCYADHQPNLVGSIRNVIGFWRDVRVTDDGMEAYAHLHLFEAEKDLRQKIESAWKAGRPDLIGASVRCILDSGGVKVLQGRKYSVPKGVDASWPRSIDLVPVGAVRGAGLVRLVAAKNCEELLSILRQSTEPTSSGNGGTPREEKPPMNWKQLIAMMLVSIRGWAADRAASLETELAAMAEDDPKKLEKVTTCYYECSNGQFAKLSGNAGDALRQEIAAQRKSADETLAEAKKALTELQAGLAIEKCKTMLTASLLDSKLPVTAQKEVERRFTGRVFTAEELATDIKAVREVCASLVPDGRVTYPVVTSGLDSGDKLQIALDKTFGLAKDVKGADLPAEIPAFKGLRHAYVEFTGDGEISGAPNKTRISAILNNAGFPSALAATLNRVLLKDYAAVNYRWRDVVSNIASPADFKAQERVRTGYFPDLSTVDPETADYAEIAAITDEKVSYSVGQKGNILTVTRKAILNDDLSALMRVVSKLGRAAARTLARAVWGKFISNSTYDVTGLAWAHATHANLGSLALSVSELNARSLAMYNQTEKDSGELLALEVYYLVIPRALWEVAFGINQTQEFTIAPGVKERNPWFHKFGENNERIIVNPLMTDANDWGLFANPADVDILEVGFLQGKQDPEFFLADAIPAEQVFVADKIRYKVRHEYGVEILDFRGMQKNVVA